MWSGRESSHVAHESEDEAETGSEMDSIVTELVNLDDEVPGRETLPPPYTVAVRRRRDRKSTWKCPLAACFIIVFIIYFVLFLTFFFYRGKQSGGP